MHRLARVYGTKVPSKVNDERDTTDATGCSFSDSRGRTCSMRVLQPSFERLDEVLLGIASPLSRSTSLMCDSSGAAIFTIISLPSYRR